MPSDLVLSVRLMTYNHSEFILQCLNSIDSQVTNFKFEVIIGDDFSTDNTADLIRDFIKLSKNNNIKYQFLERGTAYKTKRNKLGRLYNFTDILSNCSGKYIALIDGDDYWIYDYKLQKQVDFLENNKDFNICFTKANLLKNNKLDIHKIPEISKEGIYRYDNLLDYYDFITTASVMFRNILDNNYPKWFYQLPMGDMGLYLIVCRESKMKCLPEIMSVYRLHEKGLWSGANKEQNNERFFKFFKLVFNDLTISQKKIVKIKKKGIIKKMAYTKYKNNRLFRIIERQRLKIKYN